MPVRYLPEIENPWVAGVNALQAFLVEREARRRQAMLDAIAAEDRERKIAAEDEDRAYLRSERSRTAQEREEAKRKTEERERALNEFIAGLPEHLRAPARAKILGLDISAEDIVRAPETREQEDEREFRDFQRRQGVMHSNALALQRSSQQHAERMQNQRFAREDRIRAEDKAAKMPKLGVDAQDRLVGIESSLNTLNNLETRFEKIKGNLGMISGRAAEAGLKTGFKRDSELARFYADTATLTNAVIKAITGAQMSEAEAKRIKAQIPLMTDPPDVWTAKAQATRENLNYMRRRIIELGGGEVEATPGDAEGSTDEAARARALIEKYGR